MAHHRGADRVELDIALARQQAGLGIDETGAKAPFPQRAAARVCPVHMLNIALAQMLHEQRAS